MVLSLSLSLSLLLPSLLLPSLLYKSLIAAALTDTISSFLEFFITISGARSSISTPRKWHHSVDFCKRLLCVSFLFVCYDVIYLSPCCHHTERSISLGAIYSSWNSLCIGGGGNENILSIWSKKEIISVDGVLVLRTINSFSPFSFYTVRFSCIHCKQSQFFDRSPAPSVLVVTIVCCT